MKSAFAIAAAATTVLVLIFFLVPETDTPAPDLMHGSGARTRDPEQRVKKTTVVDLTTARGLGSLPQLLLLCLRRQQHQRR